jgi:prephenate dehydrogenase
MENRGNMLQELDTYIENLRAYRDALETRDTQTLISLFEEGRSRKEEVDG